MRLVTGLFLWGNFQYAILAIFIIAAVLTPSTDPWNQIVFAAPMIGLYLLSIGIAWLVAPGRDKDAARTDSPHLKLVFAAAVVDHAWRNRTQRSQVRRDDVFLDAHDGLRFRQCPAFWSRRSHVWNNDLEGDSRGLILHVPRRSDGELCNRRDPHDAPRELR